MALPDRLTATHYNLYELSIRRDPEGEIVVEGHFRIFAADGKYLTEDTAVTTLTEAERQTLTNFVNSKLTLYENSTGLTKKQEGQ